MFGPLIYQFLQVDSIYFLIIKHENFKTIVLSITILKMNHKSFRQLFVGHEQFFFLNWGFYVFLSLNFLILIIDL